MSVIVVGSGPTGLLLAGDLARDGVPVKILERRAEESNLTRAFACHARMMELLDMRGLADELRSEGHWIPGARPRMTPGSHIPIRLDMDHPESRYSGVTIVHQARTEVLLERRARELGVEIVRGAEVTALEQDAGEVRLTVNGGRTETADWVVGCDGAHSTVREQLSVEFTGRSYDTRILLADVQFTTELPEAVNAFLGPDGAMLVVPYGDGWYRMIAWNRSGQGAPLDRPVTTEELTGAIQGITDVDLVISKVSWTTRFLSERRQADRYRVGRVLLAGDAAHVHSPLGGMGMSTGIQDAANLSWKLTGEHEGWAPLWLLDTYDTERRPAGHTTLRLTDTIQKLSVAPAPVRLVRPYFARFIQRMPWSLRKVPGTYHWVRLMMSGLGISYPAPPGVERTAGVGERVPDFDILSEKGPTRLYEVARGGRFVLLDASSDGVAATAAADWRDRVDIVRGDVPALRKLTTLLIRPDGYLAWGGRQPTAEAVAAAVRQWCGPA
ncbi:hypothetical protein DVA86_18230 [Streptomyces armeniacus]|uniref:FAD-binding domain-containing protein n=1 Tax=Streptomyces armeniacus TaxID=83291 RepID=A0A345XRN4_9ACTN|nr:FAD-dependent monooxygenase [Streptomyces armeniacus]AWS21287.1 monooxygenase [Streptomyces armeniacus]AXK34300.1 hypothetical protein DVA86_18230 [Streptomyces armeniacus]AZY91999.1 spiro cyclase [Streptomyces armeniacus]